MQSSKTLGTITPTMATVTIAIRNTGFQYCHQKHPIFMKLILIFVHISYGEQFQDSNMH